MAEYTSGAIHFTGLGNGTDFDTMINQLKQIEMIPMQRLALWKADWQKRQDAFMEVRKELLNLRNVAAKMNTVEKFLAKNVASSNNTVAVATATSGVLEGNYRIEVNQLATNAVFSINTGLADPSENINPGSSPLYFSYKYAGGDERIITVPPGTTLEGLKNLINNDAQNPGVRANLIKTSGGYVFQFQGMDLGEEHSLEITGTGPFPPITAWEEQQSQDAEIKINNWPGTGWLSLSSNTISDVIEGLTINLRDTGVTVLTVTMDVEKIQENVQELLDAINTFRVKILELTKWDENKNTVATDVANSQFEMQKGSVLTGNYGVQLLSSQLKQAVADMPIGFERLSQDSGGIWTGDVYTSLSQLGIFTYATGNTGADNYGMLVFDEKAVVSFVQALAADPQSLAEFFAADNIGVSDSPDFSFYSQVKTITEAGSYTVEYSIDGFGNVTGTINGKTANYDPATHQLTLARGDNSNPADGIVINIDNLAAGNYEGTVRIKQGKVNELLRLLDGSPSNPAEGMLGSSGALAILNNNYQRIMDNINTKIEKENERIIKWERVTRARFARLDATLAKYDQLNSAIESQIKQLSSNTSSSSS